MTPRHHRKHWALTITTALAVVGLVLLVFLNVKPDVKPTAQRQVKQDAVQALVQAANTPTTGCNPPAGAGQMGSCAPVQAFSAVQSIAKAAGDPEHVTGTIGVDVSSYQGCMINWAAEKRRGVAFAFFKASESTHYSDPCLAHNAASAKAARLPFGVYDFLRPGWTSATAEARHFIAAVRAARANGILPPVADVEFNAGLSPAQVSAYVCTWHRIVRAALHRPVTITYTGAWFWNPQTAGQTCGTRLWVSAYAFEPIIPHGWSRYTFWQFTDGRSGPTPHVNGWDTDVFAGPRAALASVGHKPKRRPAPPKPAPRPKPKPKPRPVTHKADRTTCRRLNWWRAHGRPHGLAERRAIRRRRALAARGVRCTRRGPVRA